MLNQGVCQHRNTQWAGGQSGAGPRGAEVSSHHPTDTPGPCPHHAHWKNHPCLTDVVSVVTAITSSLTGVSEEWRQRNKKPQSHNTKEIFIGKSPVSQQCTPRQVQWADVPALCAYPFVINTQYSFIFVTKVLSVHIYVRYNLKYGSSNHVNFSTL